MPLLPFTSAPNWGSPGSIGLVNPNNARFLTLTVSSNGSGIVGDGGDLVISNSADIQINAGSFIQLQASQINVQGALNINNLVLARSTFQALSYTIQATDSTVYYNGTTAGNVITLTDLGGIGSGQLFQIKNLGTTEVIIQPHAGQTVDGSSANIVIFPGDGIWFISATTTNWAAFDMFQTQLISNSQDILLSPGTGKNVVIGNGALLTSAPGQNLDFVPAVGQQIFFFGRPVFVNGIFSDEDIVTVNHFVGQGTSPTIAAGTGAGTSPTIAVTGHDASLSVSVTAGITPATANVIFTVTFATAYGAIPKVMLTPTNSQAAALSGTSGLFVTPSTSGFTVTSGTVGLINATTYTWDFVVIG